MTKEKTSIGTGRRESGALVASLVLLPISGIVLLWGLLSAVFATANSKFPLCGNPPLRDSNPTQVAVVAICLGALTLGHLTARWQPIALGQEPSTTERRGRRALWIQAGLLLFLLEVIALLAIEFGTLARGVWPITYYVRCAYDGAGWQTTAAAAAVMFLVGRWLWLPRGRLDAATRS